MPGSVESCAAHLQGHRLLHQARALSGRLKHSGHTEEGDCIISGARFSVDPHEGSRGQPLSQGCEKDQTQPNKRNFGILALS